MLAPTEDSLFVQGFAVKQRNISHAVRQLIVHEVELERLRKKSLAQVSSKFWHVPHDFYGNPVNDRLNLFALESKQNDDGQTDIEFSSFAMNKSWKRILHPPMV